MKKKNHLFDGTVTCLTRRRFVQGLAMGGAVAGLGMHSSALFAGLSRENAPQILRGNNFDLTIAPQAVNFTGKVGTATAINGTVPGPTLRMREGERVTLRVTNLLPETSSIHWHGIILPANMDGVPGLSFDGIPPGETFTYQFDVKQSGTYWYHSHSGFQEQTGVYGAIIVDPKEKDPVGYDRDYTVMLSDWSDEDPANVYAKLKKMSHYYNFRERTAGDLWREVKDKGVDRVWGERRMWNQMRMSDSDISDVTGYTYTFLTNGHAPADGWTGLFKKGERVRLRFINGAAMTFFDVRIPGLKMTVVAADGQNIEPVSVDEFRIGVAETYDVIVEPNDDRAYTIFSQAIDRSGYARGTLTPDVSLKAPVPEMDTPPILSHGDMGMGGMDHSMHNMGGASSKKAEPAMDHSMSNMGGMDMGGMDHSMHNMGSAASKKPEPVMDHSKHNMGGMDHSMPNMGGATGKKAEPEMDHSMHNMSGMDHNMHNMSGNPDKGVTHAATEYGPHVDMRADNPQYRLDDPGVGLRNNGRRVLTYADIRNLHSTRKHKEPGREIELHLTGNMSRYMWSINGVKFADSEPVRLKYGERVRFTLVNDTMMNHPIHLHGMWSDLETGDDNYLPRKHTIVVQPGAKISYQVTADAKGNWAYHCHLLYHMMGMFREVIVS